jgi:hypothetical protein
MIEAAASLVDTEPGEEPTFAWRPQTCGGLEVLPAFVGKEPRSELPLCDRIFNLLEEFP